MCALVVNLSSIQFLFVSFLSLLSYNFDVIFKNGKMKNGERSKGKRGIKCLFCLLFRVVLIA